MAMGPLAARRGGALLRALGRAQPGGRLRVPPRPHLLLALRHTASISTGFTQMVLDHAPARFGVSLSSEWFYGLPEASQSWQPLEPAAEAIILDDNWYPALDPPVATGETLQLDSTKKKRKKKMKKHKLKKRRKRDRIKNRKLQ